MVYLSDVSRCQSGSSPPKLLIDAKRRTFSYGAVYQCDMSAAYSGKPDAVCPIVVTGRVYEKGIGIGTPFVLTYGLAGTHRSFRAVVGVDDMEQEKADWVLEAYLDDVKAGRWTVAKDRALSVQLDTTGARELVLVGAGRDKMLVALADASLTQTEPPVGPAGMKATNRQAMFELDDRLILDCEVLLLGRTAREIDAHAGPNQRAAKLGRTTSSRGADMWAGIANRGDLLRWQAFVRRPGPYRVWVRAVGAAPGAGPKPQEYLLHIDGEVLQCEVAAEMIAERMPDEPFTDHCWGYLHAQTPLEYGLHDVEVENDGGVALAVNRVLLLRHGIAGESLSAGPAREPIAAPHDVVLPERWKPKAVVGQHFIAADDGAPFEQARNLGLMFAPTLTGIGCAFSNTDEQSIRQMLAGDMPFTIHARFNALSDDQPVIDEQTYRRIRRIAGDRWLGFWSTEWSDCFNFSLAARDMPDTRAQAYERVKGWFQKNASLCHDDLLPMCTTWHWDHYAGQWSGVSGFQDEPGISPEVQLRLLFPRGAARQYGKVWHSYIAPGAHDAHSWVQNHYLTAGPYNTVSQPDGGSSVSWVRRIMYLTYMWGTSSLKNETPAYQTDTSGSSGPALSPMGQAAAEFFEFAATHKHRGTCYTPVSIMLDHMHGWGGHPIYPDRYPALTWGCLEPQPGDTMKDALFQVLYPGQYDHLNECNLMSPTPYGDIFDVMLSTATLEHIQDYPVLMLVGDVAADMGEPLVSRLQDYVRQGGTLVVNVAQVGELFPKDMLGVRLTDEIRQVNSANCELDGHQIKGRPFSFRVVESAGAQPIFSTSDGAPLVTRYEVGKGMVVLATVPFLLQDNLNGVCFLPHLMEHLTSGLLPFRVAGDVEYVANRNEDSWLITLINNRGVYKLPTEPATIDPRQTQTAQIILRKKPAGVSDWITGKPLVARQAKQGWQFTADVPPGDLIIVQIRE